MNMESGLVSSLSARERDILRWIAQGKSNEEIAVICEISVNTVKTHVRSILGKLSVTNRAHAASKALRKGWIEL